MTDRLKLACSLAALLIASGLAGPALGADALPAPNPERNAYFGDLHLHTSMSFDAAAAGTNTMPEDSYKYARGDTVTYLGMKVRRNVPLDFLAVTDHSEYLGIVNEASDPNGPFKDTELAARTRGQGHAASHGPFQPVGIPRCRQADPGIHDREGA